MDARMKTKMKIGLVAELDPTDRTQVLFAERPVFVEDETKEGADSFADAVADRIHARLKKVLPVSRDVDALARKSLECAGYLPTRKGAKR